MRRFNVTGSCNPQRHYMVDITERLKQIKVLIDNGEYFTINRARQYGKTTTIRALGEFIKDEYIVLSLDFQKLGNEEFITGNVFAKGFVDYFLRTIRNKRKPINGFTEQVLNQLEAAAENEADFALSRLFGFLSDLCDTAEKPVVLIIDEVDSASNNQVFLDFLAQLRGYYLDRDITPTFQSVILAGVHDVKNIKLKIRPEEAHKVNSPWNIAADFLVDMSFNTADIKGMILEYEADHHTGMDTDFISREIYAYTSGYPFLVSKICKLLDERICGSEGFAELSAVWTKKGLLEAVKLLLDEKNTLFDSLMGKLENYPQLKETVYRILFSGDRILYNPDAHWIDVAIMFGFVKKVGGSLSIANRIFEIRLYNYFLATAEAQSTDIFQAGASNKPQFISNGHLNMELVLQKFVIHFSQIYGDHAEPFNEEEGRRRFLLYLRPIINGAGNYYIEAETRNDRRMDVVVDYGGEQFVIELKIWRGNAYNERGEKQLGDYLDYFGLQKGYMLSYNFNRQKTVGVKEIHLGSRILIEAVV